jgi:transposase-like protein
MIDFPISDVLDVGSCMTWLSRHLHPDGLVCPHCGSADRRLFRHQKHFPAYRCRDCDGYYTLLTGTVFERTRQSPVTLVLLLRGVTKGESTARLARELGLSRKQMHTLRHRLQANLNETAPTQLMTGTTFEADELYQNAGEKSIPHRDPTDPPRRRANKARGRGTYATDRPPIIHVVSRESGEHRFWVCEHANKRTCHQLIDESIPVGSTVLSTDESNSYSGCHPMHGTVCHSAGEWARDDDDDGKREVHCNTCEGAGSSLRTYLRVFRGVHKAYLQLYVATYEALVNTKQITATLVRRMCFGESALCANYT